jgi:predicted DNA-binding protein
LQPVIRGVQGDIVISGVQRSYDMKASTLAMRLGKDLDDLLTKVSRRWGKTRSEIAREALRRRMMPFAEAWGYSTGEDVFTRAL